MVAGKKRNVTGYGEAKAKNEMNASSKKGGKIFYLLVRQFFNYQKIKT